MSVVSSRPAAAWPSRIAAQIGSPSLSVCVCMRVCMSLSGCVSVSAVNVCSYERPFCPVSRVKALCGESVCICSVHSLHDHMHGQHVYSVQSLHGHMHDQHAVQTCTTPARHMTKWFSLQPSILQQAVSQSRGSDSHPQTSQALSFSANIRSEGNGGDDWLYIM